VNEKDPTRNALTSRLFLEAAQPRKAEDNRDDDEHITDHHFGFGSQ